MGAQAARRSSNGACRRDLARMLVVWSWARAYVRRGEVARVCASPTSRPTSVPDRAEREAARTFLRHDATITGGWPKTLMSQRRQVCGGDDSHAPTMHMSWGSPACGHTAWWRGPASACSIREVLAGPPAPGCASVGMAGGAVGGSRGTRDGWDHPRDASTTDTSSASTRCSCSCAPASFASDASASSHSATSVRPLLRLDCVSAPFWP